jgi:hypothetical protein
MANDDIAKTIAENAVNTAVNSATNAAGYQVSKLVDLGVNGFLNILFGESREDKLKDMNEHHDKLIEIVNKNKLPPPQERLTPRESVEKDIRDTNVHISTALTELEHAREKSKCGVCKETLDETIGLVSEKTGEILDASEKVLAMQRLKESGEIPPTSTWHDLTKKEKKIVEMVVNTFKQARPEDQHMGGVDVGRKETKKPGRKSKKPEWHRQKPKGTRGRK